MGTDTLDRTAKTDFTPADIALITKWLGWITPHLRAGTPRDDASTGVSTVRSVQPPADSVWQERTFSGVLTGCSGRPAAG